MRLIRKLIRRKPIVAEVVYYDTINDIEEITVAGHHFTFGGQGDGYCYKHQQFDCKLNKREREALVRA